MIGIFLTLVDKIIELFKAHKEAKETVFQEIIEPLFNDMTIIVHDYLSLFKESEIIIHSDLGKSEIKLQEVINRIKVRREEYLHIRIKTRQMADLIQVEIKNKDVADFANKVANFFFNNKISRDQEFLVSDSSMLVDLFELLEDSKLSKRELYDAIKQMQIRTEKSWAEITRAYALLRINYYTTRLHK